MKNIIKSILLVAAIGCAAAALASHWAEVRAVLGGTRWGLVAAAALGLLVYQFVNAGVWSTVLAALGKRTAFWPAARVWVESEALRWLPGGIWGYGSRVVSAGSLGVGKGAASASLMVEIVLTNFAWGAAALLLLASPVADELLVRAGGLEWGRIAAVAVAGVALLLAMLLAFRSGRRGLARRFGPVWRRVPVRDLRVRPALQAFGSYVGLCLFNGCVLWLVVQAVPGLDISPLGTTGVAGAAWLLGFWAIGVPGGIGVREAAMTWLLAHFGSLEAGMAVAVLWRALQVVVELAALGTAALSRTVLARRPARNFSVLRALNS